MTLLETQRKVAAALMAPRTGAAAKEAALLVKRNSRMTAMERLEIYRRSYWQRLTEALREDFPGVERIVGKRRFERLARAYLADCPSRRFTLRDVGERLEGWLRENPEYAGGQLELALDMARLEWAHVVAFDGPEEPALAPEELTEAGPGLRVGVQPFLSLLRLGQAVDELKLKTKRWRAAGPVLVAVHRQEGMVYYRRLREEEFRVLEALRAGQTIGESIEAGFAESAAGEEEMGRRLREWFGTWTRFGWLTTRKREKGEGRNENVA